MEVSELGFLGAQAETQRAVTSASVSRDLTLGRYVPRQPGLCPLFLPQPVLTGACYRPSTVVGIDSDKPNLCVPQTYIQTGKEMKIKQRNIIE